MIELRAILLLVVCAQVCSADVVLPRMISSKMVLQRGVAAPIWGWADPGEKVMVEFAGQTKTTLPDATGKWMVHLDPLSAASESRAMTIQGSNEIMLLDVLVGEVWLASGQSNMEWTFYKLAEEEKSFAVTQKDNRLVRAFHVENHLLAEDPLGDTIGRWKNCHDILGGDLKSVSAVGFFFALKLQQELEVPVAILDANWGGKKIELFIPQEGYEAIGLKTNRQTFKRTWNSGIYNAMIAPLAPYAIKGALWYQGESNLGSRDYFKKLQGLSIGWSQVFNLKEIPIHLVQIAPFDYDKGKGKIHPSLLCDNVWMAQYRGTKEIPNMTLVPSHDTHIDINDIHPVYKRVVGERLASKALANQYGKEVVATGPGFASARLENSQVIVSFDELDQGLATNDGKAPSWFELSADGKTFAKADALIKGDTVQVSAKDVPAPKFVRMGWYNHAIPNLADKNGWPVFPFPASPVK